MPYGISKAAGGDTKANTAKMDKCVLGVMKTGKSKQSAIRICKAQMYGEHSPEVESAILRLAEAARLKEDVRFFSGEWKIDEKLAERIIKILYDKNLDAQDLSSTVWRIREMLSDEYMPALLATVSDADITSVIDEMIAERAKWEKKSEECCGAADIEASEKMVRVWLMSETELAKEFADIKAGDKTEIQIMRVGRWDHPTYGKFAITQQDLQEFKKNFDENKRRVELAVDINHEQNHEAVGWFKQLSIVGDALMATIEWTSRGAQLVAEKAYRYFSPELTFETTDDETGETIRNLLLGGAITNRPFFKAMQPLSASEESQAAGSQFLFITPPPMKKFLKLLAELSAKESLSASEIADLSAAFGELPKTSRSAEMKAEVERVTGKKFNDDGVPAEEDAEAKAKAEAEAKAKTDEEAAAAKAAEDAAGAKAKADEEAAAAAAGAAAVPAATEQKIEAAEKEGAQTVTLTLSEVTALRESAKNASSIAAKSVLQLRRLEEGKKVEKYCFSEANKTGRVLPKDKDALIEFVMSLSEEKAAKFYSILDSMKTVPVERGAGPSETTVAASEEETKEAEIEKFFAERMKLTPENAKKAAQSYMEELRAKK